MNSKSWTFQNSHLYQLEGSGNSLDSLADDMFVEWPSKVALQKLVIVHSLGNDATHKLVVAEVIAVTVGGRVYCVGDPVSRWSSEQSIHRVEDFPGNDDVPLSQKASSILTLFTCKYRSSYAP